MSGHVFVVRGDLTQLACDDWLLPVARNLHVSKGWWRGELVEPLRAAGAWHSGDPAWWHHGPVQPVADGVIPLRGWDVAAAPRLPHTR